MENNYKGRGALDAFFNLFALITLGWLAISVGGVLFKIIDSFFNGKAAFLNQMGLKFNVASIIVVAPVFLIIAYYLHRHYKSKTLSSESGIHRWLTYLMLLIAALFIIGSLIALIFKLLDGASTSAFLLKALAVLLMALGIFGYYLYDLRRKNYDQKSVISVAAFVVVVAVCVASVIGSFFIIDSPKTTRLKNFDQQRVAHLSQLNNLLNAYYFENGKLPADLSQPQFSYFKDPESGKSYDYAVSGEKAFELCAGFSLPVVQNDMEFAGGESWSFHGAGYQCFSLKINDLLIQSLKSQVPNKIISR